MGAVVPHKFKIVDRAKGQQVGVQFAYNGDIVFWSESYKGKASAKACIASLKKNAPAAPVVDLTKGEEGKGYRFEIDKSKNGQPFVRFVARNGETMVRTERDASKTGAKNAIRSLQESGPGADTEDTTK